MTLTLLPGFARTLPSEPEVPDWILPVRPNLDTPSIQDVLVDDANKADRLLTLLGRLAVGAIAFDTEFGNHRAPVDLGRGRFWSDPRSIRPLLLSAAIWVPDRRRVIRVAFDLRVPEVVARLPALFRLGTVFVAHFIQAELHTLWSLELEPVLHQVHDTHVAARALDLGRAHGKVTVGEEAAPERVGKHALLGLCARYDIPHPHAGVKDALQQSFLDHPDGAPFSPKQIDYALADAEVTLRVYLAQQPEITAAGLGPHLHQVEFPFAEVNARMIWDGVPVSLDRLDDLHTGLLRAVQHEGETLHGMGLENARSPGQVLAFLSARGLRDRLFSGGKVSTEDAVLERIELLDPAITHIRRHRKYARLLGDRLFDGSLIGADGRLHPRHSHLGAATGRNTCSAPNIVGITKTFRPIVTAPPGRALVELDFAQIEVCIAAAVHGDPDLLAAANSGDVYSSMAQMFYRESLPPEQLTLDTAAFKRARPDLRNRMKVFTLATIYNMTDRGVADSFGVSLPEARRQRLAFFERFPGLAAAMRQAEENGAVRGFAPIAGGLRRWIERGPKAANQHVNTPVQGAAGVVFRKALVDLHRHFRGTGTFLGLPVHDAVVLECDAEEVADVAAEAALIMKSAVRAYFPELRPRIDVNAEDPTCWNKDGKSDSLQRFLSDPDFKL